MCAFSPLFASQVRAEQSKKRMLVFHVWDVSAFISVYPKWEKRFCLLYLLEIHLNAFMKNITFSIGSECEMRQTLQQQQQHHHPLKRWGKILFVLVERWGATNMRCFAGCLPARRKRENEEGRRRRLVKAISNNNDVDAASWWWSLLMLGGVGGWEKGRTRTLSFLCHLARR